MLTPRVRVEPRDYSRHLREALEVLSRHLPRTLVLLLAPAQVSLTLSTETRVTSVKSGVCHPGHGGQGPGVLPGPPGGVPLPLQALCQQQQGEGGLAVAQLQAGHYQHY